MADKMVFPIGFDLQAAVDEAGKDWDKKYAKRLEDLIAKRPINVKLKLDTSKLDSLDAVKKRLTELKIEPITPATKTAIKELAAELKTLAKALEQVQKYSTGRVTASPDAVRAARIDEINKRSEAKVAVEREKARAAAARAAQAELRLAEARRKAALAATKGAEATRNANREFKSQDGYISRLIKRLAVYAGYRQITNFLTSVREVTAQFELQRVSLGAIIQDQTRANALFSEIKSFALKSPVSILDLTKYTKQLAAYKIGVDELFETTKKLTDVSVGLGVSMDRVVLAYGQTRATGYLRASEIRQFTEMGVPIVEELAAKLSKMNGELVTAAQVMDMVSKRSISFELVKEVFDDMTSAGGMFYNMQEKQGNTLYGMWAKLGDAASVMYDQIGNTSSVNSAMKYLIHGLTDLMKHWRFWSKLLMSAGGAYMATVVAMKLLRTVTYAYTRAGKAQLAIVEKNIVAQRQAVIATRNAGTWTRWSARLSLIHANAQKQAALATNIFSKALYSLKAAFLSNPLGMIILGITTLIALFDDADDSAKQFAQSLSEIEEKYTLKSLNDADNFKQLADAAIKAAEGSKEQREKLEELDRTYGNIVGSENLQIDKLRDMNGEYQSLIDTIEEYNIKMKYSEREGAIKEYYGGKKKEAFGDLENEISTLGHFDKELGHTIGASITIKLQDALLEELEKNGRATMETARKVLKEQFTNAFKSKGFSDDYAELLASGYVRRLSGVNIWWGQSSKELDKFVESINSERAAIEANSEEAEKAGGKLAKIYGDIKRAKEELAKVNYVDSEGKALDTNSFLFQQSVANETMKKAAELIRNSQEMKDALGDKAKELEPMWLHLVDSVSEDDLMNITTINFDAILKIIGDKYPELKRRILAIQKEWGNIAPTNETALQIRQKLFELSISFDPTLKKMKRFLWDGSGAVDDYLKRLKEQQEKLKARLKDKQTTLLRSSKLSLWWNKLMGKDISAEVKELENEIAALDKLIPYVTEYTNPKEKNKKGGTKSDTRLQTLNEIEQTLTKINQKYEELLKKEGQTKALADIQNIYGKTLDYINQLGKKFKLNFAMPTDFKTLQDYRNAILKVIETLKMKGYEKAALELQTKIETGDVDQLSKQIEQKLKDLSDKISRTKTAREFYDKILSQTGSYDIAGSITMSIYGDDGQSLLRDTIEQLQMAFENVDISAAIDLTTGAIDYNMLRKFEKEYSDKLIAGRKDLRDKLISEGEKASAAQVAQWYKDIEKAKDYNQQYVDIVRETQTKIAEIRRSGLDKDREEELVSGMEEKQRKALKKLQLDEFRSSDLYVRLFEDMDSASTTMLQSLKDKLDEMKKTMREDLTPKELKSLTQDIEKLEDVLQQRNPFKTITAGLKGLRQWHKENGSLADAEKKLTDAIAEEDAARKQWEADTLAAAKAQADLNAAMQQYQAIAAVKGEDSEEAQTAKANADAKRAEANAAKETARKSEETYNSAVQTKEEAQETVRSWERWVSSMREGLKVFGKIESILTDMTDAANNFMDAFAASDETRQFFDDILGGLNSIVGGAEKAATGMLDAYAGFKSANPMQMIQGGMSAISGLSSIAKGVTDIFYAGRIKKANKEIKKQQQLLEQLEYVYGRLEKAADKVFGVDYLNNYNRQVKNLQAQAAAYQKQAAAERSKGKKADKDKIKEYENAYRETMDEIADMQGKLSEKFLGSDQASAARDFAKAWLEAYKEVGRAGAETSNKMKEKFQDMIENMVVEGALAAVMQKALQPMFDMIDNMNEQDFYSESFWKKVAETAAQGAEDADKGAQTLMKFLEQAGISIKDISSEYTGIKRDIAGASEETMSNVATIGNTLMYYVSPIPGIAANVAIMRQIMENGNSGATTATTAAGWTDWQQQAMDHYAAIQRNTADTVVECRRAAQAAENAVAALNRVITVKGSKHGVQVYM